MLMSREVSAFVGTFFFVSLSCYVIYHGNMPDYLRPALIDTIKAASDSAYSNCDYTSYVLEFKKMLEGVTWWGMFKAESMGLNKGSMVAGWVAFIIYNALSGIAISRLSAQSFIVYQNVLGVSVENDVKEDLEQARPKQEPEKQKQELEKQKQEKQDKQEQKPSKKKKSQRARNKKKSKNKRDIAIFFGDVLLFYLSSILASNSLRIANPVRRQKQTNQKNSLSMLKKFYLPIL